MYKKIISIVFIIFLFNSILISQESEQKAVPLSIGLYAGFNINLHSPSFNYKSDLFFDENSTGIGAALGFTGLLPINHIFVISGKIG